METRLPPDFRDFLRLLTAHGAEYLLVGGYAVGYHGYPRATEDIDIWIAVNPDNAERMVGALREFGFDSPQLTPASFLHPKGLVRMGVPPLQIEVVTFVSGLAFEQAYPNRVTDELDGVTVSVISLADLRANKLASGRHKDLADLEKLPE